MVSSESMHVVKKMAFLAMAGLLLLISGCGPDKTAAREDKVSKIGFIYETMTVERWQRDRDIFVAKAENLGAEVIVKNAYEDCNLQREIAIEMIKQGVDVLVIVAVDKASLRDLVKYARNRDVNVIAYDRMIRDAEIDFYISFDNEEVGRLMGQAAVEKVPEGNYLILNGTERDNNSFMINEGYYSVLDPYIEKGAIKIVGETWIDAWRTEGSYEFVSKILNSGQKVDAIIAANDQLAEGAITALSENRLAGEVFVTGQDAELGACRRIVEGTQGCTVYKPISNLAEGAAEIAVRMAEGRDIGPHETIFNGAYDIPCWIYKPLLVTRDNIDETVIKDGFFTAEQVYRHTP
ncbi:MAG TPA: substrate-binding domain-containing protein [Clostridiales bacterium]|jgi:D-xylose transport system substrate-binding protein|nr:substrate-binding domain-containing protein [Clostridiales bacterium]HPZ04745.1 substrate-binding domain-containing protein [Clostridiales bacterium]HQD30845.1 substrate-binding domain-containing protein [Clostridiales bacterium]